jgi:hypothetical protein
MHATCPAHLIVLNFITLLIFCEIKNVFAYRLFRTG